MVRIGAKLKQRARALGLSDAEVARRLDLSASRYGHYVKDVRQPDFATFLRICRILETTPNSLLGFDSDAPAVTGSSEEAVLKREIFSAVEALGLDGLRTTNTLTRALLLASGAGTAYSGFVRDDASSLSSPTSSGSITPLRDEMGGGVEAVSVSRSRLAVPQSRDAVLEKGGVPDWRSSYAGAQEIILSTPLLKGVCDHAIDVMLNESSLIKRGSHTLLFGRFDVANSFFIVIEGNVKLFTLSNTGKLASAKSFGPGSSFGEIDMLTTGKFSVSAEVIKESTLIQIKRDAFVQALFEDHVLAFRILGSILTLSGSSEDGYMIGSDDDWKQIAEFLLAQTLELDGSAEVNIPSGPDGIANKIGISYNRIANGLLHLRKFGVRPAGNTVHIDSVAELRHAYLRYKDDRTVKNTTDL